VWLLLREEKRLVMLNIVGLASLVAFTGLVYLRTQEPLILVVGGLISVVSVVGTMMRKS
jgi:hypothetical protein